MSELIADNIRVVSVYQQPIELCKLLKIADLVNGGGEAKIVISEGYVYVNGELAIQKRKKVYAGDIVEFNGDVIQVAVDITPILDIQKPKPVNKHKASTKQVTSKQITSAKVRKSAKPQTTANGFRKPITF
jgi:ribosome-associated protein